MEIVKRPNKVHVIYDSAKEFLQDGSGNILVENWREGQEGDWVLTDNGRIVEVLRRATFKHGKDYIRTVCGMFIVGPRVLMDTKIQENPYSFSGKFTVRERRHRKNINRSEKTFAIYIAKGKDRLEAYKLAFPRAKREIYIDAASQLLMKTERVQNMIDETIADAMDDVGITKKYLLQKAKDMIERKRKMDDKDIISVIKLLMKASGMLDHGKMTETALAVFQGFSEEQLAQMTGRTKEIGPAKE